MLLSDNDSVIIPGPLHWIICLGIPMVLAFTDGWMGLDECRDNYKVLSLQMQLCSKQMNHATASEHL